jgi:hypothetical protein
MRSEGSEVSMESSSVEPVRQFNRLNQSLVESEIDFSRTVHFTPEST